jgi:hypothetical protein
MNTLENEIRKISRKLDSIEKLLIVENPSQLDDFISEEVAKKILKRGTTWFWELRKSGFPYSKLGGQVFYNKKDLIQHFESNMKGGPSFEN